MNENAHNISVRWTTSSQEYFYTKAVSLHRGKQELKRINKDAREQWILLRLKSKYAGKMYLFTMNTFKKYQNKEGIMCLIPCFILLFFWHAMLCE